jgi:hypothetical protein
MRSNSTLPILFLILSGSNHPKEKQSLKGEGASNRHKIFFLKHAHFLRKKVLYAVFMPRNKIAT